VRARVANLPARSARYLEAGAGHVVLLVHAFPLSADQWLPQCHRVPAGRRVIAPDLRGFRGAGPAFEDVGLDGVTIDDYARDVLELLSHLDVDRALVVGLSMGGYVALALARLAPARVAGLLLANTRAGADSDEGRAARDRMATLVARGGPAGVAREMLPKLLGDTTRRGQPDLEDAVRDLILANSAEAVTAAILAMKSRHDATPFLSSLSCPVGVVWSDEDAIIARAEAEALTGAIPGAELTVIDGAGHLSNLERPAAFEDALASVERRAFGS
jgi:3-oxoadipate enol-lactonase